MPEKINNKKNNWLVYIILCSDNSLYTGITTDMERRFAQHKQKKGAKYFFGRNPLKIVFIEDGHNRSSASRREYEIKSYTREDKIILVEKYTDSERKRFQSI